MNPQSKSQWWTKVEVRYQETDAMGIVHHSAYVPWFELTRIRWLAHMGLPYAELESSGRQIPVLGLNVEFKKAIKFGVEVDIGVSFEKISKIKFIFRYEVYENQELCTIGSTEHVVVEEGKPIRIPDWLLKKFPVD